MLLLWKKLIRLFDPCSEDSYADKREGIYFKKIVEINLYTLQLYLYMPFFLFHLDVTFRILEAKLALRIAALDRIRNEYEGDTAIAKECAKMAQRKGFRSRFNAVFGGIRVRFNHREYAASNAMI